MSPPGGNRTPLNLSMTFSTTGQGNGYYGAGSPLTPPQPMPPRVFDFAIGQNRIYTPRTYEPFSFANLRSFANVELIRLAIETRKDQVERLGWRVRSKDEKKPKRGAEGRITRVEALLRKPDGRRPFATWLRMALEDLFVLDAPAIERRRTFGGELVALDLVPGDTINLLVDDTGRTPVHPDPAYQQVIKGRVWADFTERDMIYAPRNLRTNHLYGFGPVEQIVVTLNTLLQRQTRQLAWFTSGNTPEGLISAPEGWTPDQIKQYQAWFDERLRGLADNRAGVMWGPHGAQYTPFKESPLKDDFDEWLARVVCFAFSLPPTPFIKQMNRSTSESDSERSLEEGLEPTKLWAKRLFDGVIQDDLGFDDLEFDWVVSREIDPDIQSQIDDRDLKNGSRTIDEIRDSRGQQPYPDGLGNQPLIYTASGVVRLEDALTQSQETNQDPADPNADPVKDPKDQGDEPPNENPE